MSEQPDAPIRRPVEGEITLNGDVYVPVAAYDAKVSEAGKWRRTLALAHMYLSFGDAERALAVIERDTGDTIESARAVRSVVDWVLTETRST